MTDEKRIRMAFKILFYNQNKIRNEIVEIKKKIEEIELRMNNLFKIRDN